MIFVNSPIIVDQHPNAVVIASGGILFEIDSFEEGAEFRQHNSKGIIKQINKDSFIAKYDDGYEIHYPLPFENTNHKNLSFSEEDMYKCEYWKRPKKVNKQICEQLNLFAFQINFSRNVKSV